MLEQLSLDAEKRDEFIREKIKILIENIAQFYQLSQERQKAAENVGVVVADKKTISLAITEGTVDESMAALKAVRNAFLGDIHNKRELAAASQVTQLSTRSEAAKSLAEQLDRELAETMGVYIPELKTIFVCNEYLDTEASDQSTEDTLNRVLHHELLHVLSTHDAGGGVSDNKFRIPLNEAITEILRMAQVTKGKTIQDLMNSLEGDGQHYYYSNLVKTLLMVLNFCNHQGAHFSVDTLSEHYFGTTVEDPAIMGTLLLMEIGQYLGPQLRTKFMTTFDPPRYGTN